MRISQLQRVRSGVTIRAGHVESFQEERCMIAATFVPFLEILARWPSEYRRANIYLRIAWALPSRPHGERKEGHEMCGNWPPRSSVSLRRSKHWPAPSPRPHIREAAIATNAESNPVTPLLERIGFLNAPTRVSGRHNPSESMVYSPDPSCRLGSSYEDWPCDRGRYRGHRPCLQRR